MTAGVRSGKAQNEPMFFRFGPQSGHRELASMCPLGAVKALRAAALHDGAGARAWRVRLAARFSNRTSEIVQPARTRAAGDRGGGDHQASKRGVIGEGEHGLDTR